MADGIVFHIQRFSVHDGPGIRSTVFLKGCSLSCAWCHNPEGIRGKPELRYQESLCIHCGECVSACSAGAHRLVDGIHHLDRDLCTSCGACAEVCPTGALVMAGRRMSADEVVREVLRDKAFYDTGESRGGITLSGGEPVSQAAFAREILSLARVQGLHTAIQTAANVSWAQLEGLLPLTDLVMLDIKHMDPDKHREATGSDNRLILANAERLAAQAQALAVRIPVVPGFNDTPREIGEIRRFVESLKWLRKGGGPLTLSLLPFHPLAGEKYASLGLPNRVAGLVPPTAQRMRELGEAARLLPDTEEAWQLQLSIPA